MKRVLFDVILVLSIFTLPWWVNIAIVLIGIFVFKNYVEFIVAGIIIYGLYIITGVTLMTSPVFFTALILITFIGIQLLKDKIILYKNDFSY